MSVNDDLLSIAQACELVGVSRPTWDKYRRDYNLQEKHVRGRVYFSKLEIIEKIIYTNAVTTSPAFTAVAIMFDKSINSLFIADNIADLRGDIRLDAFGIITLLCKLKSLLKDLDRSVYLLVDDTFFCRRLKALGFFNELEKGSHGKVFYRKEVIGVDQVDIKGSVILPLNAIGYRGAEKKILGELYDALMDQGFSEDLCSYLGWIVGEISDNCHTHSKGGPCFLMIESVQDPKYPRKFLSVVIGDTGIGIQDSLRTNPKHANLSDASALASAFLSDVSSWSDEHKRGKGLNDVMGIALGNQAWLRCDANGMGIFADFYKGAETLEIVSGLSDHQGTRIALILMDSVFKHVERTDVNNFLNTLLEKL